MAIKILAELHQSPFCTRQAVHSQHAVLSDQHPKRHDCRQGWCFSDSESCKSLLDLFDIECLHG